MDEVRILRQKKIYLDSFIDMYNSEILSYSLSIQTNAETILSGLEKAIAQTNCPYHRMFHSD